MSAPDGWTVDRCDHYAEYVKHDETHEFDDQVPCVMVGYNEAGAVQVDALDVHVSVTLSELIDILSAERNYQAKVAIGRRLIGMPNPAGTPDAPGFWWFEGQRVEVRERKVIGHAVALFGETVLVCNPTGELSPTDPWPIVHDTGEWRGPC